MHHLPLIIHAPHASVWMPHEERGSIVLDDKALRAELLRMTDAFTDELFEVPDEHAHVIRYPVSRLLLDPERFEDDAAEPMSARGMGVIYTRTSIGTPLRHAVEPAERERLLDTYYRPHHARLTDAVEARLQQAGACLIVDAHSFASNPLPYEVDQSPHRPDICLGTDDFHTPHSAMDWLADAFRSCGYSVELNRPYSGSMVPMRHYRLDARVASVMIEINRGIYMDEETGRKSERFNEVRTHVARILEGLRTQFSQPLSGEVCPLEQSEPVASETKVDCLNEMPVDPRKREVRRRWMAIYSTTNYVVQSLQGDIVLRVDQVHPALDSILDGYSAGAWAFITACNPFSNPLSDRENQERMLDLERHIRSGGWRFMPGYGKGDDGQWPAEPSMLVVDISPDDAVDVARKYGQNAIVYGRRGDPARLLWA